MLIKYIKLVGFKRFPLSEVDVFEHSFNSKMTVILGPNGSGKAQPLTSLVKVPNGWKKMGDIEVGDKVIAANGSTCNVIAVHPQGVKEIFKVTFSDGRYTRVTADHLWKVHLKRNLWTSTSVLSTSEIMEFIRRKNVSLFIDLVLSEKSKEVKFDISPYNFGMALANNEEVNGSLIDLYKNSSHRQRFDFLRALMDKNGYVTDNGLVIYESDSINLVEIVRYLVRSLGGMAKLSIEHINHKLNYKLNITYKTPSSLFKKQSKVNRAKKLIGLLNDLKLEIVSIEPDGYEEAKCISIDHPSKLYITDEFIVTHNSSLLSELTPLPSSKDNFNKNGYKEIHIEHNSNSYVLISDFKDSPKYSFLCNGEELNISSNVTTQRELVYKHFKLTDSIHRLLIGADNFTDLTLLARKKLFNTLTHLNIDAILSNYNSLKEELKNNEYALKTQSLLYQQEESKLLDQDKLNELEAKCMLIKEYIDILFSIRTELSRHIDNNDLDDAFSGYKAISDKIKSIASKYYIPITSYPYDTLEEDKRYYTNRREVISYRLKELYYKLEECHKQLKLLELNRLNDIDTLQANLNTSLKEIEAITKALRIFKDTTNIDKLENSLYTLEVTLPEILRHIPTNEVTTDNTRLYSKERYNNYLTEKAKLLEDITSLVTLETTYEQEIRHIEQHKDNNVTCPNCKHTWAPNYSQTEIDNLRIKIQDILKEKLDKQNRIQEIDKEVNSILDYFNLYKQYKSIRDSTYLSLQELWDIIDSKDYIFNDPTYILQLVNEANLDIVNLKKLKELRAHVSQIEDTISKLKSIKDSNTLNIEKSISSITEDINILLDDRDLIDESLHTIAVVTKVYEVLNSLTTSLANSRANLFNSNLSYTLAKVIDQIDSELSISKINYLEVEKEINSYNSIKYLLSKYQSTIDDLKENIKILELILNELSPKNGIIAKTISNFLNVIITGINNIIASIWDYKMNLKVINVEEDVLNYRFKVEVEDKITIDDISKVSSGMKEIINLSFRLMLYKLLKLDGYSLYLDEFGVKLDKVHRSNISNLIFKFLNSSIYSQIFLVTHLDLGYSVFNDTEVLELP